MKMKVREAWRAGLKLSKAQNLEISNALRKARRSGELKLAERLRALLLVGQQRLTQPSAAKVIGVSTSSITRWVMAYERAGIKGVRPRTAPGAKPRLTEKQFKRLRQLIVAGPEACGYD